MNGLALVLAVGVDLCLKPHRKSQKRDIVSVRSPYCADFVWLGGEVWCIRKKVGRSCGRDSGVIDVTGHLWGFRQARWEIDQSLENGMVLVSDIMHSFL